jgi:hypothetical protein
LRQHRANILAENPDGNKLNRDEKDANDQGGPRGCWSGCKSDGALAPECVIAVTNEPVGCILLWLWIRKWKRRIDPRILISDPIRTSYIVEGPSGVDGPGGKDYTW